MSREPHQLQYAKPRRREERMPQWLEVLEIAILIAFPVAILVRWLFGRFW